MQEAAYFVPEINPEEMINNDNSIETRGETASAETISDIIAASSGLLALQSHVKEKQEIKKIIQKELVFEKIITIKAPMGQNFMGYALLQSLQNAGLKFSSKGLFYYIDSTNHDQDNQDKILFELSPSIEPYRFNLAEIGNFKTPGLVLKIIESADERITKNFAETLAEELGGEIEC